MTSADVVTFLQSCQAANGGYGGGPRQLPHLAPSYAAVATLVSLGGAEALASVDRTGMLSFLQAMAVPASRGGGFQVCCGMSQYLQACSRLSCALPCTYPILCAPTLHDLPHGGTVLFSLAGGSHSQCGCNPVPEHLSEVAVRVACLHGHIPLKLPGTSIRLHNKKAVLTLNSFDIRQVAIFHSDMQVLGPSRWGGGCQGMLHRNGHCPHVGP